MNVHFLITNKIIFTTREIAFESGKSLSSVSRSLLRLAQENILIRVTRGVWANQNHPFFTPYALVPVLLGTEQGYVSFFSALHRYEVISQIPSTIQIATTGRSRKLSSGPADFEFIQISPELMTEGFSMQGDVASYNLAEKEKALFDCLYISTRKGNRFSAFPELTLDDFNFERVHYFINRFELSKSIREAIRIKLEKIINLTNETRTGDHCRPERLRKNIRKQKNS